MAESKEEQFRRLMMERNAKVIEEFRSNGGKVGGDHEGRPLLLLTTIGAKTGQKRINPLTYLQDGDTYVVFASKGGAPTHPDWFNNLTADAAVVVEVGDERFETEAVPAVEGERARLFEQQAGYFPHFWGYQEKTTRKIPAVVLARKK